MVCVDINVGGTLFRTTRDTLLGGGGYFAAAARRDQESAVLFVDRDPTHFRHVLNWMRGSRHLPADEEVLGELLAEADFYSLTAMCDAIRERRWQGGTTVKALQEICGELRRR